MSADAPRPTALDGVRALRAWWARWAPPAFGEPPLRAAVSDERISQITGNRMRIGLIGAGNIGGALARRLTALGHDVSIANSRGPETLSELARETGATAVRVQDAARDKDLVVVTIPESRVSDLPEGLLDGAQGTVVVDTGNYYPRQRDGRIEPIEAGMTESRWVEQQLGHPVIKAFNNVYAAHLQELGRPAGDPDRIALPVAGDHEAAKATVLALVEELGFDAVDAGGLDESWRQQPGSPVYGTDHDADGVRAALAAASPERAEEFRGTAASPGTFAEPA